MLGISSPPPESQVSPLAFYNWVNTHLALVRPWAPKALSASRCPRLIEDETFNDCDIINNLIDYEDGQEAEFFESG
ncbi:hypothetical protein TNCV_1690471 [Trichonephila clavipes]|nr:hypothetical protein TNCV_1690471 [Trichonephila clavipes]